MIKCIRCKILKDESEFYLSVLKKHWYICKKCQVKFTKIWKLNNPNKTKEHNNKSSKLGYVKHNKKWKARCLINRLIRDGYLQKEDCAICGSSEKIEAHHENYDIPNCIIWLCAKHHLELTELK